MKKLTRTLALIGAAAMLFGAAAGFVSCSDGGGGGSNPNNPPDETPKDLDASKSTISFWTFNTEQVDLDKIMQSATFQTDPAPSEGKAGKVGTTKEGVTTYEILKIISMNDYEIPAKTLKKPEGGEDSALKFVISDGSAVGIEINKNDGTTAAKPDYRINRIAPSLSSDALQTLAENEKLVIKENGKADKSALGGGIEVIDPRQAYVANVKGPFKVTMYYGSNASSAKTDRKQVIKIGADYASAETHEASGEIPVAPTKYSCTYKGTDTVNVYFGTNTAIGRIYGVTIDQNEGYADAAADPDPTDPDTPTPSTADITSDAEAKFAAALAKITEDGWYKGDAEAVDATSGISLSSGSDKVGYVWTTPYDSASKALKFSIKLNITAAADKWLLLALADDKGKELKLVRTNASGGIYADADSGKTATSYTASTDTDIDVYASIANKKAYVTVGGTKVGNFVIADEKFTIEKIQSFRVIGKNDCALTAKDFSVAEIEDADLPNDLKATVFTVSTATVANDEDTLGLVATGLTVDPAEFVGAELTQTTTANDTITITSVEGKIGKATITASDGTNSATIAVTVKADGSIEKSVTKYKVPGAGGGTDFFWDAKDYSSVTADATTGNATCGELEFIKGSDGKAFAIDTSSKSADGHDFTHRLKFQGTGAVGKTCAKFAVEGACTIKIYFMSGKSGTSRPLVLSTATTVLKQEDNDGNNMGTLSYSYTGDGEDLYIYSGNSGVNVYGVSVEY